MVAAPTRAARTVRAALRAVLDSDQVSLPARVAALVAAGAAGLAAPAGLLAWALTTAFAADGPAHRPEPGWLHTVLRIGTPATLAAALVCLGWALVRNYRGKADGDLLIYATLGLLLAFGGCVVAGMGGSS